MRDDMNVNPFLVPRKTNSKGLKTTASITLPLVISRHVKRMPKMARLACCASFQKCSPLEPPNHPPRPNHPPPPALPPPPTSSLFWISLFHFSNSVFFPPRALSNAFFACSCLRLSEKKQKNLPPEFSFRWRERGRRVWGGGRRLRTWAMSPFFPLQAQGEKGCYLLNYSFLNPLSSALCTSYHFFGG